MSKMLVVVAVFFCTLNAGQEVAGKKRIATSALLKLNGVADKGPTKQQQDTALKAFFRRKNFKDLLSAKETCSLIEELEFHLSPRGNHRCPFCPQAHTKKQRLVAHCRVHYVLGKFNKRCGECRLYFTKYDLERHMDEYCLKIKETVATPPSMPSYSQERKKRCKTVTTDERLHNCAKCGIFFGREQSLETHWERFYHEISCNGKRKITRK